MKAYRKEITNFLNGMSTVLDGNVLPQSFAECTYNFDFSRGSLEDGYGLEPFMPEGAALPLPPVKPRTLWQYSRLVNGQRQDMLLMWGGEMLYALPLQGSPQAWRELDGSKFTSEPIAINYRLGEKDVLIVTSQTSPMFVYEGDGGGRRVVDSPYIKSMCVHYERLWAVMAAQPDRVWFSSDLDPTAWDISLKGAGYITMPDERGHMLSLLSFLDYVYIFREYGITRISAYAEQTSFNVSHLFTSSGRIFGETVALCGDRVLFAASDGLYVFDGVETRKILTQLSHSIVASAGKATFSEGKYYLTCRYRMPKRAHPNAQDGQTEAEDILADAVLIYDVSTGTASLFVSGKALTLMRIQSGEIHEVVAYAPDNDSLMSLKRNGAVLGEPTHKVWTTAMSDFGQPEHYKYLSALTVTTRRELLVTINVDGKPYHYQLPGCSAPKRIHLCLRGKRIGFEFCSRKKDCYVSRPIVEYRM